MSIDTCARCGRQVDTDEDTEFYDVLGTTEGHCNHCRELFPDYGPGVCPTCNGCGDGCMTCRGTGSLL